MVPARGPPCGRR